MEYVSEFMEQLLRIEAEAKGLFGVRDREYEQSLMQELSTILEEAEFLFGPRDQSYELLEPRITECGYAHPYIYPFNKIRIYLTSNAKGERYLASYELAHETIHVLSPAWIPATVLEEGLATYFSLKYVNRVYNLGWKSSYYRNYDAAMHAVSPLLAKNQFVIKELRAHQPVISKIDDKLLIEVAGIELHHARLLCTPFESYGPTLSFTERAEHTAQLLGNCVRSIWDWKRDHSRA